MTKSDLLKYALKGIDDEIADCKSSLEYWKNKGNESYTQFYFEQISKLKHERELIDKKYQKYTLDRYYGEFHDFD